MLEQAAFIVSAYLCGSVSFSYLAGRLRHGIDLRQYGSRKLSGSNVYEQFGVGAMILVGVLDLAKAALPTWLGIQLGFELPVVMAAAVAAMIGHNWSLFLALKGGRGIGTVIGSLLVVFPLGSLWLLIWLALGRLVPRAAAIPALIALITLPILAAVTEYAPAIVNGCLGVLIVTIVKRLEANRELIPEGKTLRSVLWRRLLLDRDISEFDAWMHRTPDSEGMREAPPL